MGLITMTNTRISMAEAYDNKDVIQQILLMKDTVRNGTYADLSVERGTGADIGKIVFDFTLTSGEHQVFKVDDKAIASTSAAQAGTTVTVTVSYNDGTSDTFTFSTLIGAMTLDTAQTATAKKTFSAGIAASNIEATGDLDVGGDATVDGQMQIGSNLAIEDSSSDSVLSSAGAIKLTANHVEAGSRAYASAGSSDVLVKSHVANMPVVHLTGNENIGGQKTFTDNLTIGTNLSPKLLNLNATGGSRIVRLFNHHLDVTALPAVNSPSGIIAYDDINGVQMAALYAVQRTDGKIELRATLRNIDGTFKNVTLGLGD